MNILKVPYFRQKFLNTCFPTCVKMVLAYFGDSIGEREIYKKAKLPGYTASWDVKMGPLLVKRGYKFSSYQNGSVGQWEGVNKITVDAYNLAYKKCLEMGLKHRKNATVSLIRKFLKKGMPVLAEVGRKKFYGKNLAGTHMVVIIGFDKSGFYMHDPDPFPRKGGKCVKISYGKFRNCWEKIQGDSGRSMVVIGK